MTPPKFLPDERTTLVSIIIAFSNGLVKVFFFFSACQWLLLVTLSNMKRKLYSILPKNVAAECLQNERKAFNCNIFGFLRK